MNFDDLQKTWARQTVTGHPLAGALQPSLVNEIRQRGQAIRRLIAVGFFLFVVGLAVIVAAHFTGIKRLNVVTLTTFVLVAVFELGCLAVAVQAARAMHREAIALGETMTASLRIAARAVDRQIRNCRFFAWALLLGCSGDLLIAIVHYSTGNLPLRGLVATIVAIAVFGTAIAATLRRYYREKLVPRRAELRRALAELDAAEAG